MKKIKLLVLALVAMISAGASAQTYEYEKLNGGSTEGTWSLADLQAAVAADGSATIALGIVSNTSGSYGTTDGPNYFLSIDNNKIKTLENKNVFTIEPAATSGKYTLKTQDGLYVQTGSNGGNANLGTAANAAQFSLSAVTPTDYDPKYASADKVRFDIGGTYLNCQDKGSNTGYRNGKGGFSAFVIWKIQKTEAAAKTYTIVVTGCTDGRVVYDDAEYADGAELTVILDESKLSAKAVDGYNASVAVDGTTITATYTAIPYPIDPTCWDSRFITAIGEELTTGLTPSTDQWYLLKQDRRTGATYNFPSPVVDTNSGTLKRAATDDVVTVNTAATDAKQYLIRIIPGTYEGSVYFQFGTGKFFGADLTSSTNPGDFRIYNANSNRSYGHWAINETNNGTTDLRKVDQNGAGNTLAYWESGTTTEGGNNIWALYPVTLGEISGVTYDINIVGDPSGAAVVTIGGNQYTNGQQATVSAPITALDVTAQTLPYFNNEVEVEGSNVNVVYFVTNVAAINNESVYTLTTQRGTIYNDGDALKASADAAGNNAKFGLVRSDKGNIFVYSVGADKFVNDGAVLTATPSDVTVINDNTGDLSATHPYYLTIGTDYYNVTGGTVVINYWSTIDPGNQVRILYAGAYDLTAQVEAVNEAEVPSTITITISAAKRGTFVSEYDLDFTGAQVFAMACTGLPASGAESIVMTDKLGKVKAGTALYVGADAAGEYEVTVLKDAQEDDFDELSGTNYFIGNLKTEKITIYNDDAAVTRYILQKKAADVTPKFYKVASTGNTVGSHRAYLQLPISSATAKEVLDIAEEGDATAINGVDVVKAAQNGAFNLAGQSVNAQAKGIVIVNGKKVFNK